VITIQKTDITPETAEDTSRDGIIIKREISADINNVIIRREETRAIISKGAIIIAVRAVVINNEGIMIREEVTGRVDTSKEVITRADIIRAEDTSKEVDTSRAEVIVKAEDTIRVEVITVADTSNRAGINSKVDTNKGDTRSRVDTSREDPEEAPICAGHNRGDVVIIQGKISRNL
jgi:hypothetical protein